MKRLNKSRFCVGAILCALPLFCAVGTGCAADAGPSAGTKPAATSLYLRDSDEMRAIEVQSDRKETVEEFFARQKLSFVGKPNTDGKFWSVSETIRDEPLKFFASYPLDNDHDFALYRFGAFYEMAPTSPTVSALFQNSSTPLNWSNTLLIVAPTGDQSDTATAVSARIVGYVFIKDAAKWTPSREAEKLKYQGAQAANAADEQ